MQEGDASSIALLGMLQTATEGMPTAVAAEHADTIFELLRQALGCRQQQPAAMRDVGRVEHKAVQAFVAATLKLSEARFKPIFLRLLEWASVSSKTQSGGHRLPCARACRVHNGVLCSKPPSTDISWLK